jgi:hypothetical protein
MQNRKGFVVSMEIMDFRCELGKICPKIKEGANIYFFGTGRNFEYWRRAFRCTAKINLEDYAAAFIDNDTNKQGKLFYGKPVVSPDEITTENSVVVITVQFVFNESIAKQMMDKGFIWMSDLIADVPRILYAWNFRQFMQFSKKHKGERCFIIASGPSLQTKDLDMLINENTFGLNSVFKIFDKTIWRPSYYVCIDNPVFYEYDNTDFKLECTKFLNWEAVKDLFSTDIHFTLNNSYYFHCYNSVFVRPVPWRKASLGEYPDMFMNGGSSLYTALQIAVFMGFDEIYILGADNLYPMMLKNTGEVVYSESDAYPVDNYTEDNPILNKYMHKNAYTAFNIDIVNDSFKVAREYAEARGIKIYNATRGGKLDVFERVNFDNLF